MSKKDLVAMMDLVEETVGVATLCFLRRFKSDSVDLDITQTDARMLLYILHGKQHFSQKEINDFMEVTPSTISRLIDGLEQKGLVRRVISADNRRENLIMLTDTGQSKAMAMWERTRLIYRELFGLLDNDELVYLQKILVKVKEGVSK